LSLSPVPTPLVALRIDGIQHKLPEGPISTRPRCRDPLQAGVLLTGDLLRPLQRSGLALPLPTGLVPEHTEPPVLALHDADASYNEQRFRGLRSSRHVDSLFRLA